MKKLFIGIIFIFGFGGIAYGGEIEQLQNLLILHKDIKQGALATYRLEESTVRVLEAKIQLLKAQKEKEKYLENKEKKKEEKESKENVEESSVDSRSDSPAK